MSISEVSSIILGLGTLGGIVLTFFLNRRGQDIETREQDAANRLERRKTEFDQAKASVDLARADTDRAVERADRADTRADRADERAERAERRLDEYIAACDATQRASRDVISTLRGVVLDEAAREAGDDAVREIDEHDHGTPDRPPPRA